MKTQNPSSGRSARWYQLGLLLVTAVLTIEPGKAGNLGLPDVEMAPPVAAVRAESNNRPRMAYNRGRWLVVWENKKLAGTQQSRLRAALVDDAGTLLTPFAVDLGWERQFPMRLEEVSVAAWGDGFVVVWTQIDPLAEAPPAQIIAAVVNLDGQIVRGPYAISDGGARSRFPKIATFKDSALVVWLDDDQTDGTLELKGQIIDPSLAVARPVQTLSPAMSAQRAGGVAFANGSYLVVCDQVSGVGQPIMVHGTIVRLDGTPGEPFPITTGSQDSYSRVSPCGDGFIVVQHDFSRDFGPGVAVFGDVKAVRVSAAGQVLDNPPILLRDNPANQPVLFADVSGSSSGALATWTEALPNSTLWQTVVRRISPDGTVSIPSGESPAVESFQHDDLVSSAGSSGWLVAHSRDEAALLNGQLPSDVYLRKLNGDGSSAGAEVRASATSNRMRAVAVTPLGAGFVAVWQDDRQQRTTGWDIYARRFRADGTPLDAQPFAIADALDDQASPSVSSSGDTWAAVWRTETVDSVRIEARVMSGDAPVSAMQILDERMGGSVPKAPEIASGPGGYLAVWVGEDKRLPAPSPHTIKGTGLSNTGQVSIPGGFYISPEISAVQEAPAVASNGASYFVAWRRDGNGVVPGAIWGRWLPSAAPPSLVDPPSFAIISVSVPKAPDVGARGEHYLVVCRTSRRRDRIWGARVDGSGQLLTQTAIEIVDPNVSGSILREPTVASTASTWLVAWLSPTGVMGVELQDNDTLKAGAPFALSSPATNFEWDTDTLRATSLSDRIVLGAVKNSRQSASALITFPGRSVPGLRAEQDPLGNLHVTGPNDPYFPLSPNRIEVSTDGRTWQALASLPESSWSQLLDGSLLFTPTNQVLLVRLKATLASPQ